MSDYKNCKVGIIDLGINNIFSIKQIFKDLNCDTEIYKKNNKKKYNLVVLPGVGSFKEAMKIIRRRKLDKDIYELQRDKKKTILGICLGMQLFFNKSNEFGVTKGLSLIKGNVKKFPKNLKMKTHIGWKKIYTDDKFFNKINNELFYFVHSYLCDSKEKNLKIFKTKVKNFSFVSGIFKENLIGLQFHPEKSGVVGIKLIKRILNKIK